MVTYFGGTGSGSKTRTLHIQPPKIKCKECGSDIVLKDNIPGGRPYFHCSSTSCKKHCFA